MNRQNKLSEVMSKLHLSYGLFEYKNGDKGVYIFSNRISNQLEIIDMLENILVEKVLKFQTDDNETVEISIYSFRLSQNEKSLVANLNSRVVLIAAY